jgi:hypothetical protein
VIGLVNPNQKMVKRLGQCCNRRLVQVINLVKDTQVCFFGKRASMTKKERLAAQRRKKAADPGQQEKTGAYVSTDPKKKMKKEEVKLLIESSDRTSDVK